MRKGGTEGDEGWNTFVVEETRWEKRVVNMGGERKPGGE
jgi:hypothetical protein